jgi:hypothetical protein
VIACKLRTARNTPVGGEMSPPQYLVFREVDFRMEFEPAKRLSAVVNCNDEKLPL